MNLTANLRGVSIDDVLDSYWIFLARNDYSAHLEAFKKRLNPAPYLFRGKVADFAART